MIVLDRDGVYDIRLVWNKTAVGRTIRAGLRKTELGLLNILSKELDHDSSPDNGTSLANYAWLYMKLHYCV